jgi:4-amino-4-deoxy-L-arabinose transferase-like glycosyltransferase
MMNRPMRPIGDRGEILRVAALLLLGSLAAVNLMGLPVFEDEATQLRLIYRIVEAGEWLQPLNDAKPLEAWLMVPLVWLAPHPLAMIRALHVFAGMLGALLTYRLALQVGDRWTAFTSGVLFAICPFVVYLQRLALSDMLMCTAGTWVLLRTLELINAPTTANSGRLAVALVLAAFCKLPIAFIFMGSLPLALVLLPSHERHPLLHQPVLTRVVAAHAPAALLAAAIAVTAVIRVRHGHSPGFGLVAFIGVGMGGFNSIAQAIGLPRPNLITELTAQLSWPVVTIGLVGLVTSALRRDWRLRWLIAVGALPMLGIGLLATFWYSRYLLFTLPPLIVAAVAGWQELARRARPFAQPLKLAASAVCVGLMGRQSALLILDPPAARWSPVDRFQYFEGWGSGYGYPEAAQFVLAAADPPAMIYSLEGHSAYQLRTYLPAEWRDRVSPIFYAHDGQELRSEAAKVRNLLSRTPVWIIIPEPLLHYYLDSTFGAASGAQLGLRRIAEFNKPGSRGQLAVYEVPARPIAPER